MRPWHVGQGSVIEYKQDERARFNWISKGKPDLEATLGQYGTPGSSCLFFFIRGWHEGNVPGIGQVGHCLAIVCVFKSLPLRGRTNTTCFGIVTKGSPLGDTLSLSCEASVGTSGSNN